MPQLPFEQRRRQTTVKLAALMLANAFIFQEQLAALRDEVESVNALLARRNFIGDTAEHWAMIAREIDYVPIFSVARDILTSLPTVPDTDLAIRNLAKRALQIVSRKAALRHDLMGRIYHLLLQEAKYLGTYYTSVPAATLLLKLSLDIDRWPEMTWSDASQLKEFQIADLACGTGTLLMAASQALTDNYIKYKMADGQSVSDSELRDLHKLVIEEMLSGYDVLPSAVHLTASTLALLAPETCFEKMRLFSLSLGKVRSGQIYLGSIDYLSASEVHSQLDLMSPAPIAARQVGIETESIAALSELDLCVMNPPFVRSVGGNLLFGSVPNFRKEMQKELARRIKDGKLSASSTAGLGSVFAAIGDRHLKPGGRLSLVLPAAVLNGVAWEKTRHFINQRYVLETVIVSHDPERWNFSENTNLSEALIIARKRTPRETNETVAKSPTLFINLWKNPTSSAHALAVGDTVSRSAAPSISKGKQAAHEVCSLVVGNEKYGEMIEIPWGEVKDGPWLGCCFAQTELVRAAWLLKRGLVYLPGRNNFASIPVRKLNEIAKLGPDRRDIYDGFELSRTRTSYPAFWGNRGERNRTIAADANKWLSPRAEPMPNRPARDVGLLWPRAGRVMIAEGLRLDTQRIAAVFLDEPALANVWWPVRLRSDDDDEAESKVLALWLNSSLGLLTFLSHRTATEGSWVHFKKPTIEALPVLNPAQLSRRQMIQLAEVYDSVSKDELDIFQNMADDPTRIAIDDAISKILGIPTLRGLRNLLAREPAICGRSLSHQVAPEAQREASQFVLL